jgi:hypothetical protein
MNFLINSNNIEINNKIETVIDGFDCNFALDNVQRSLAKFLKTNPEQILFCVGYQKIAKERAKGGYDECFPIDLGLAKTSHHSAACAAVNKMLSLSAEMLKDGVALLPIAFRWDDLPAVMGE